MLNYQRVTAVWRYTTFLDPNSNWCWSQLQDMVNSLHISQDTRIDIHLFPCNDYHRNDILMDHSNIDQYYNVRPPSYKLVYKPQ